MWGFAVAQVLCWHGTFTINSLSHLWGGRRYATTDDSRNNFVLAHRSRWAKAGTTTTTTIKSSARNGFLWWEIDVTYYVLRALAAVHLVRDLHGVPAHVLESDGVEARPDDSAPEPAPGVLDPA